MVEILKTDAERENNSVKYIDPWNNNNDKKEDKKEDKKDDKKDDKSKNNNSK